MCDVRPCSFNWLEWSAIRGIEGRWQRLSAGQSWNIGNILVVALLLNGGGLDIGGTLGDQDPALP